MSDPREPPVSPALTSEEWARDDHGCVSVELERGRWTKVAAVGKWVPAELIYDHDDGHSFSWTVRESHVIAALALYGQPFGFTREDCYLLWSIAASHEICSYFEGGEAAALNNLVARIEALLPPLSPEETK